MNYPLLVLLSQSEIEYLFNLEKYTISLRALGLSEQQVKGLITLCRYAAETTTYSNHSFILACAKRLEEQAVYGVAFSDIKAWCLRLPTSIEAEWLFRDIKEMLNIKDKK